jgi:hypothetical protein
VNERIIIYITTDCGQDRVYSELEHLFKTGAVKNQRISDEFVGELSLILDSRYPLLRR